MLFIQPLCFLRVFLCSQYSEESYSCKDKQQCRKITAEPFAISRLLSKMHDEQGEEMIQTEQRKLGASELVVPALGIGTMSWGELVMGYGKTHTRDDVIQAYRACPASAGAGMIVLPLLPPNMRLLASLHQYQHVYPRVPCSSRWIAVCNVWVSSVSISIKSIFPLPLTG